MAAQRAKRAPASRSRRSRSARAEASRRARSARRVPVPPDPDTLREISQITGGTFTETGDAGHLDDVYEKLGSKVGTKRVKREVTSAFAAGGLVLLLAGLGTGLRWRGRLP